MGLGTPGFKILLNNLPQLPVDDDDNMREDPEP
jgi:hypothetical protein